MKITKLASIGVVVSDLDGAMSHYARLLDLNTWHVNDWTASRLSDQVCHGRRTAGTYRNAVGATPFDPEGEVLGQPQRAVGFELVSPVQGETPFMEFLMGTGEGIAFLTVVADDAAGASEHFGRLGIATAHVQTRDDGRTRTFYDTRDVLGGYLLEVIDALPELDGEVVTFDGAALREGRPALPCQGILHFGVVVPDLMKALSHYRDVFGIEQWAVKTWENGEGRLDEPYYRDQNPVHHGYFTAQGFCDDFGFEVIAMKYGPAHYNREFTDDRGAGIHHIFPFLTTDSAQWDAVTASMTELGAPLVMGSELRGRASCYGYYDTFETLGGFLIEGVNRRQPAKPEYMAPDFEVDFTQEVSA